MVRRVEPLRPFFVITKRGHGIRDAADANDLEARLEREMGPGRAGDVIYTREASPEDIHYSRVMGGSLPRKYREPETEDETCQRKTASR